MVGERILSFIIFITPWAAMHILKLVRSLEMPVELMTLQVMSGATAVRTVRTCVALEFGRVAAAITTRAACISCQLVDVHKINFCKRNISG